MHRPSAPPVADQNSFVAADARTGVPSDPGHGNDAVRTPSSSVAVGSPPRAAAMPFILLTVLIDMVSIGIIVPVLPFIVGSLTGSLEDQVFWYGAMTLCFGVANFFASPLLGGLSDQYGRRPVLLVGFCGLAFSFFGTALATHMWMLLAIRVISGAMQANVAVANAYVADITLPDDRARRFGMLGAMFGLGFILGPVLGGVLGDINTHLPFFVAGGLALVNLAYGWFVLPESLPADRRRPMSIASANPLASLTHLSKLKNVGGLVVVVGLANLAQLTLHSSWVLSTSFRFGWGPRENGWSLCAVGLSAAVVQGFLLKRLLKLFGAPRLVMIGLISGTLSYLMWGLATDGWMMFAIIAFNLFGATVAASINSLISAAADARTQGQTMGAVSSLMSLASVLAPVVATPLLGVASHLPHGDWRSGAPFYFCALMLSIATLFAARHFARQGIVVGSAQATH